MEIDIDEIWEIWELLLELVSSKKVETRWVKNYNVKVSHNLAMYEACGDHLIQSLSLPFGKTVVMTCENFANYYATKDENFLALDLLMEGLDVLKV